MKLQRHQQRLLPELPAWYGKMERRMTSELRRPQPPTNSQLKSRPVAKPPRPAVRHESEDARIRSTITHMKMGVIKSRIEERQQERSREFFAKLFIANPQYALQLWQAN